MRYGPLASLLLRKEQAQLSILQESETNILGLPQNQQGANANALNYSLYVVPEEPLKSFSPYQIAVRWRLSTRAMVRLGVCVSRADIPRALELIGVTGLSMHQVRRYFSNATYREKFPGRSASSVSPGDPRAALIFTYSEVFLLAVHADLIGTNFDVVLPSSLAHYVDSDSLRNDVNDRQSIKDLLKLSKYSDDG